MDAQKAYDPSTLSRRERQIMDIIYSLSEASVNQVLERLPDPPGRTAVRTLLRILEEKSHVSHRRSGREFIYLPSRPRVRAGISAFQHVLDIFYNGSLEKAVAAHLSDAALIDEAELARLEELIEQAKQREARGVASEVADATPQPHPHSSPDTSPLDTRFAQSANDSDASR
jgi:BlaI family penicillinase repressor